MTLLLSAIDVQSCVSMSTMHNLLGEERRRRGALHRMLCIFYYFFPAGWLAGWLCCWMLCILSSRADSG